jgi:hypothetical protein
VGAHDRLARVPALYPADHRAASRLLKGFGIPSGDPAGVVATPNSQD